MTNASRVVAVLGTKGGIGKTTTTMGLAGALAAQGHSVEVLDADPQGSSITWAQAAREAAEPLPYRVGVWAGTVASRSGWVIVDGPPGNTDTTRAILQVSDLAIMPTVATGIALDRVASMMSLVEEAAEHNPGLLAGVLLSQLDQRLTESKIARELLEGQGWPVFDATIPRRAAIARLFGTGQTHWSFVPLATEVVAAALTGENDNDGA